MREPSTPLCEWNIIKHDSFKYFFKQYDMVSKCMT